MAEVGCGPADVTTRMINFTQEGDRVAFCTILYIFLRKIVIRKFFWNSNLVGLLLIFFFLGGGDFFVCFLKVPETKFWPLAFQLQRTPSRQSICCFSWGSVWKYQAQQVICEFLWPCKMPEYIRFGSPWVVTQLTLAPRKQSLAPRPPIHTHTLHSRPVDEQLGCIFGCYDGQVNPYFLSHPEHTPDWSAGEANQRIRTPWCGVDATNFIAVGGRGWSGWFQSWQWRPVSPTPRKKYLNIPIFVPSVQHVSQQLLSTWNLETEWYIRLFVFNACRFSIFYL